jgi:plastocyanin
VRPGDAIRFKQTWTGEPHSVTLGTIVDTDFKSIAKIIDDYQAGKGPLPDQPPAEAAPFVDGTLPGFFGQDSVAQNAAKPCYLDSGAPPKDPNQVCPQRAQPVWNGRQSYYSSGFIPYQGLNGNTYTLKLAADTKPGKYRYYCNVHNVPMSGVIDVVAKTAKIPSQGEVDRQAQKEIDRAIAPALKLVNRIKAGKGEFPGNVAGAGANLDSVSINEFFPKTITTKVNQKVTWTMAGGHTISFNVPKYLPIITAKNGKIDFNGDLDKPVGWTIPQGSQQSNNGPPPPPRTVDIGKWDGKGFHSTGTQLSNTGDKFSVTFTKPGTYLYACIIHPPMVGKVIVKP